MIADDSTMMRLMAAAQRGDKPSYRALLDECRKWLLRYYARRVPPHQMEDLVQDTLLSVHNKRASYDPDRPFLPWLAAIARYRWVDHLRRQYRADEIGLDDDFPSFSDEPGVTARISLDHLMLHLPPGQSEAIALVKIEGLSIAEAAAKSGQSESLVKVNIHRGLKRLAALVEQA